MTCDLFALCIPANDPVRLAGFWAGVLGRETTDAPDGSGGDGVAVLPGDDTGFRIRFPASRHQKSSQNRAHFDLTSTSQADQQQTVERSLALGARHVDVGQLPEEGHVVLADPEGNEFCVVEPGSSFLAGCGVIGALSCDGSQQVGHFWSAALGWPLVWDQDEETAIQSPLGGPKISWGGPPLMPKAGTTRLHLDLALPVDGDPDAEVERLVSLGATRVDTRPGDPGRVVLADPDGDEFCLLLSGAGPRVPAGQ